ncbi:hypothetical protein QTI33_18435 [Variovorax sp. J22P271]|uniref:hypothetical protein n=1 Tax=Variovorax davisae TaxID=3053515 RepID=UPI00257608A7|nr:hypothetical protein [Variovorax sp. J22P271]MDM0034117.1 hypothetical protein [Variovorax sp. J22P271]
MKNIVLALLLGLAAAPLWAQSSATAGGADLDAERARLAGERTAISARYDADRAACYKKFAVEGCLQESRQRRRLATDDVKRQEAEINDLERKRRGAAALDKLDEKGSAARAKEDDAKREQSLKSQQDREQRAADHAAGRTQAAIEAAEKQRQFDDKQRAHAEEQAKAARRRAEAPAARQAYDDKMQKAEQHRADNQKRNADKTKPRSAPLPDPGTSAAPAATPTRP